MIEINLPVKEFLKADVVVVGGGTSGCFAAISSARAGANTVLIEKNGMLGGTITAANVNFPGLFFAWGKQIISGPCWELIKRAEQLDGARIPVITEVPEKHWHEQILVNRFIYTRLLDEFCGNEGVNVNLHTMLSHAIETENGVRLIVTGKEGLKIIDTNVIIDASGDANLTTMLGYKCFESEKLQPATLINDISGYDIDEVDKNIIFQATKHGLENNQLPEELNMESIYNFLLIKRINFHVKCVEAATSEGKSKVESDSRKKLFEIYEFMKTLPKLENIQIDFVAEESGIRETKRIIGEAVVSESDYVNGTVFDDAVCYAFYPVDLHVMEGIEQVFLKKGVVPTIPYRALIPKGSKKLLTVGRCVSSDANANSALRVQAPCMAMGQAAGCAAAIASLKNLFVKNVEYDELCSVLTAQGAIVPDNK